MTYGEKITEMINVIHSLMEEAEDLKEFIPADSAKWTEIYRSFKYMDVPLVEMLYKAKKNRTAEQDLGEEYEDEEEDDENEPDDFED